MSTLNPNDFPSLQSTKYYVRMFYIHLAIAVINIGVGITFLIIDTPASAGTWIIFSGIWLLFVANDRKNILRSETITDALTTIQEEHHTERQQERNATENRQGIETIMKEKEAAKTTSVEPVDTTDTTSKNADEETSPAQQETKNN
jgi:hypothetical protein